MEIKVTLQTLIVKDEQTGETYRVKTLRTAQEVVSELAETEKEVAVSKLEAAVSEAYQK